MTEENGVPANITEQATAQLEAKVSALEATKPQALSTYKEFWGAAKYVNEMLRSAKFLDPELLGTFRQRVDAICEKVKEVQEEKARLIDKVSKAKCNAIEHKIQEAKALVATDNQKAQQLLKEALNYIKDEWGSALATINLTPEEAKVKMSKDDHDASWLLWKQVNEDSFVRLKETRQNNYVTISNELYAIGELVETAHPGDVIDAIKEFQKKLKGLALDKKDWEEIRETLNKYWQRADERYKTNKSQRNMNRIQKRKDQDVRKDQWRVRQEANIQKFNELISKNFDVITRIEQHVEKLIGDKEASRSEIFKTKVEGWIKEQQDKINDIVRANRELNDKIEDIQKKINEEEGEEAESGVPIPAKLKNKKKKETKEPSSPADSVTTSEEPTAEIKEETPQADNSQEEGLENETLGLE